MLPDTTTHRLHAVATPHSSAVLQGMCPAKAQVLRACADAQAQLRLEIGLLATECARYETLAQRVRAMPGDEVILLATLL